MVRRDRRAYVPCDEKSEAVRNPSLSVSNLQNTSLRMLERESEGDSESDCWSPLEPRVLESRCDGERCLLVEDVASSSLMTSELSTSLMCAASHLKRRCVILLLAFAFSITAAASASQAASRRVIWIHRGRAIKKGDQRRHDMAMQ